MEVCGVCGGVRVDMCVGFKVGILGPGANRIWVQAQIKLTFGW